MTMEITHLGSGSRGNATLLQTDEAKVLIDCGFSGRQMERRLGQIGVDPKSVDAIVLSHHHTDSPEGRAKWLESFVEGLITVTPRIVPMYTKPWTSSEKIEWAL